MQSVGKVDMAQHVVRLIQRLPQRHLDQRRVWIQPLPFRSRQRVSKFGFVPERLSGAWQERLADHAAMRCSPHFPLSARVRGRAERPRRDTF
jgi:hypothetical protein